MNPQKFSAIAHRDHDYCNPISAAKVERLLDLLPLDETSRVLDLGCGRAELALRIIERFGSTVIAVVEDCTFKLADNDIPRVGFTAKIVEP